MICSPASPAIRKPIATSWMVVFHFASLVTGTLTRKRGEIFPQARYQDFAAQDHDRGPQRPAMDAVVCRQHQQAGRHQKLVGDRIEHPAEGRLLIPDSRIVAIEIVGHARGDEDGQRHPAQPQRARPGSTARTRSRPPPGWPRSGRRSGYSGGTGFSPVLWWLRCSSVLPIPLKREGQPCGPKMICRR